MYDVTAVQVLHKMQQLHCHVHHHWLQLAYHVLKILFALVHHVLQHTHTALTQGSHKH